MFTTQKVLKKENKNKNREKNKEEKHKETLKKIKNIFKLNKLILYVYLNSFIYFSLLNKD